MNYKSEIEINLPISRVIELFDNPENMKLWMKGLQSFEHISGIPGQPGAKSKLKFIIGKRKIEMIETITVRNLPHEFSGTYEAKGVFNIVKNFFIDLGNGRTKYINDNEFQFKGIMKIFALIMPGTFKKETLKQLTSFKHFAENQKK